MSLKDEIILSGLVSNGRTHPARIPCNAELIVKIIDNFKKVCQREPQSTSEAIFLAYHEMSKPHLCICGEQTKYINFKKGWFKHCSSSCAARNPESQEKLKQTNLKRRGVSNPSQSSEVREKFETTMLDRHGVKNPMQSAESKKKSIETTRIRYGVDHVLQSESIRESSKQTLKDRYGVEHPMKSPRFLEKQRETNLLKRNVEYPTQAEEVRLKAKRTNMERFGYENVMQAQEVKDKARSTWQEKYGVDHPMRNINVVANQQQTCLDKYGVACSSQRFYSSLAKKVLFDEIEFGEFIKDKSLSVAAQLLNVDPSTIGDYCNRYNIEIPSSSYEKEISEFLKSIGITFILNTRKVIPPLELDFFIPDHNLALEFNGLYWYSEAKISDKRYHLNKHNLCKDRNIRLLMIREDEWLQHSDAIKSRIMNICGKTERGVGARKTEVHKISNHDASKFVEEFHIQGATSGVISSFGAYSDSRLVGVMQFSKQRNTGDIELVRYCVNNKLYPGLFSKMFKYAAKSEGYVSVISFADLRYSNGDVYERNGFVRTKIIPPDYTYCKNLNTYHKSLFTKKRIQKKFDVDMSMMTERQAMKELGYLRIYDCGKIRYLWTNLS